jgi:hypothetical protein
VSRDDSDESLMCGNEDEIEYLVHTFCWWTLLASSRYYTSALMLLGINGSELFLIL